MLNLVLTYYVFLCSSLIGSLLFSDVSLNQFEAREVKTSLIKNQYKLIGNKILYPHFINMV